MKFSRFIKLVRAGLGEDDFEIDYIDVDLNHFDDEDNTSVIASAPGRKEGTFKVWLVD